MFDYIENVKKILSIIEKEESKNIQKCADILTTASLNKNAIFIFGASHSGILSEEVFYRAGGMMTINPIFSRETMLDRSPISFTSQMERLEGYGTTIAKSVPFKEGDVLIVHSVSGRNALAIDIALHAKSKGAIVIAITNVKYSMSTTSRHSTGLHLCEIAHLTLDNHGDIGDASCTIEGIQQKVGPTSTVVGATLINTVIVETCRQLVAKGMQYPPIFYAANLDGGDQKNKEIFEQFKEVIYYQY